MKSKNWGGARKGAGRPSQSKRSTKVKLLGLRMLPEERDDILAACTLLGIENTSSFMVGSAVNTAREILHMQDTVGEK